MVPRTNIFLVGLIICICVMPGLTAVASPQAAEERVVVMLRDDAVPGQAAARHRREHGVRVGHVYGSAVRGYAAAVTPEARAALLEDPDVRYVADDVIAVQAVASKVDQELPTGVDRVEGELSSTISGNGSGAVDIDVAIVDGGFEFTHPDLDLRPGKDCRNVGFATKNNHGTAVAGVVGALDNTTGVVGVAPGARMWAVNVADDTGRATLSDVLCGLDWVVQNAGTFEVVNMSLSAAGRDDGRCGRVSGDPWHEAICRMTALGVTSVAATGNEFIDAARRRPAAYSEVIAVSALADFDGQPGGLGTDCFKKPPVPVADDTFAYFSNFGTVVDLIAPGMCIPTTDIGGKYTTVDGTSFAAPHVAGAAALYLAGRPQASPRQVLQALTGAGRFDYDSGTDPDGIKEPLLDVSTW